MRKIKFWKMSGAGNDFVLLPAGRLKTAALKELARSLCPRGTGVGADGLLAVAKRVPQTVSVRYFNADGSEAFCGNGSRCAAWWAYKRGLAGKKLFLLTAGGRLAAEIAAPERVRMSMPDVRRAELFFRGKFPAGVKALHFLNTGVPHAVVPVTDLRRLDVAALGRALRHNPAFGPAGANVNFVKVSRGRAEVRTYERGVEAETLACGTGLTACAVALALAGAVRPPVRLTARSGEKFSVSLKAAGAGATEIAIEGPAKVVFSGEIQC